MHKQSLKNKQAFSSTYIGIVLGSLLIIFFLTALSPRGAAILGAQTSIKQDDSWSGRITSFLSSFLKRTNTYLLPATISSSETVTSYGQIALTKQNLLALADNKYANGVLPLGDNMYVTDGAKKGYIYLCNTGTPENGGGAQEKGDWIYGNTWNSKEKLAVTGHVSWSQASFTTNVFGTIRTFSGNDLPISHTTGMFPIGSSEKAYQYDKNPNSISSQTIRQNLPVNPTYSDLPYCMGGEVGIMLSGIALFNGFDANHRDAAAWEVQDDCDGHPQVNGEYHYHSLSSCITDISVDRVIGFALDGFPITGSKVATDSYLTTEDLDICHGITSEITLDGKKTTMYHYVMTQDFPYSVSCFRAKPVSLMVTSAGENNKNEMHTADIGEPHKQVPAAAMVVCNEKTNGTACTFPSARGKVTGTCQMPPGMSVLACVPSQ